MTKSPISTAMIAILLGILFGNAFSNERMIVQRIGFYSKIYFKT